MKGASTYREAEEAAERSPSPRGGGGAVHTHTYLLLIDGDPVGGGKPLVSLDVIDSVLEVPVAFREVHLN